MSQMFLLFCPCEPGLGSTRKAQCTHTPERFSSAYQSWQEEEATLDRQVCCCHCSAGLASIFSVLMTRCVTMSWFYFHSCHFLKAQWEERHWVCKIKVMALLQLSERLTTAEQNFWRFRNSSSQVHLIAPCCPFYTRQQTMHNEAEIWSKNK